MTRIWIIGASGSGKSTLARQLAQKMGAHCIDLDELHWRPGWQTAPQAEFLADLERAIAVPSWVIAGYYSKTQTQFIQRGDTLIWLDYAFPTILWRLVRRTFRRIVLHQPCCNGNYESLRLLFSHDSVILWLFRTYNTRRRGGWNTKRRARHLGMNCFHFRHPAQCAKWLQTIGQTEQAR